MAQTGHPWQLEERRPCRPSRLRRLGKVRAALGVIIIPAHLSSATPKASYGFELDVFAATFVDGASARGGVGGILHIGMGVPDATSETWILQT